MKKRNAVNPKFFKSDLLKSKKYAGYRDILSIVLVDNELYDTEQVDKLIATFLARKEAK